jgi:hypothetical protein
MEKVVSLGLDISTASGALREQLKLPRGVGVLVDQVHTDAPAKAAGIVQHDVLEKLNDQWLINSPQYYTLLRGMKAGDEVTLTVIHQGERKTVKAKLEEREQPQAAAGMGGNGDAIFQQWIGGDVAPQPGGAGNVRGGVWNVAAPAPRATAGRAYNTMFVRTIAGDTRTEWADDELTIAISRKGDKVDNVMVTDKASGKIIFNGKKDALDKEMKPNVIEKVKKAEEATAPQTGQIRVVEQLQGNADVFINDLGAGDVIVNNHGVTRVAAGGGAMAPGGAGFGGGGMGGAMVRATAGGGRGKVMRWQDAEHVLILRSVGNRPTYLLALSTKDGRVIYDGPVESEDQQKSVPAEVSEEFGMLVAHPDQAKEFGVTNAPKPVATEPQQKR